MTMFASRGTVQRCRTECIHSYQILIGDRQSTATPFCLPSISCCPPRFQVNAINRTSRQAKATTMLSSSSLIAAKLSMLLCVKNGRQNARYQKCVSFKNSKTFLATSRKLLHKVRPKTFRSLDRMPAILDRI